MTTRLPIADLLAPDLHVRGVASGHAQRVMQREAAASAGGFPVT